MYHVPNLTVGPSPSGPLLGPPTQLTERQFVLDLLNRHNVSFDGTRTRTRTRTSRTRGEVSVSLKNLRLASLILLRRPELLSQGFLTPFLNLYELGVVLDEGGTSGGGGESEERSGEKEDEEEDQEVEGETADSDAKTKAAKAQETCDLFFIAFVDDVVCSLLFREEGSSPGNGTDERPRETDFRILSTSEVENLVACCQFVRRVVQSLESSSSSRKIVDVRCAVVEFLIRHFPAFVRVVIDAMKIVLGKRQELWDVCESLKKVVVRWTIPREPIRLQLAAIRFVTTLIQCFTPLMDHVTASELKSRENYVEIWAVDHHDGSAKWCGSKERIQLALTDIPLTHDVFKKKRHLLWIDTQMLWKLLRDRLFPSETPLLIVTCVLSCMLSIGKVRRYWADELVRTLIEYQDVVDRRSQERRRGDDGEDEDGDVEMGTGGEEEGGEMMDQDGSEAGKKKKLSPMQRLSLRTVLKFAFLYLFNIPMVNRRHRSRLVGILTSTYEIPDDYIIKIVGYCENATAPSTGPAVAQVRKRKRMAFEEADLISGSRAEQKSPKKPKLDTVSTPLGPKTPLQLSKIVVANLVNIPTPPPPVGTPRPTREAFLQCLFKMCSVLHPAQRSVIQQFSSVQLLPTPEAIAKKIVDADGDAKMRDESTVAVAAVPPQPAVPSLHLTELNVNFEPSLHVDDLGSDEVGVISEITWKKILLADLAQEGCEDFRHSVIVRHVVSCPSEEFVVELINHIKGALGTRFSLLIRWLYAEFIILPFRTQTLYDDLFQTFLDYILEKEKWKLKDFVVLAPKVIPGSVEKILSLIFPPNNLPKLGVEILVSLFSTREPLRVTILGLLLNLCFDGNISIRNEAVVAISGSIYPVQMYCRFRDSIEEAAHGRLKQLCEPSAPSGDRPTDEDGDAVIKDDETTEAMSVDSLVGNLEGGEGQIPEIKEEEEIGGWNRELVKQYCSLAYSLATKNHELFDLHISTATKVRNSTVRAVLLTDVDRLVIRLGPDSPILVRFAATFYEESDDDEIYQRVLLKALRSRRELPSLELIGHVKRHYFERNQNAHLLLPIITTLTKEEVSSSWESMVKSYSREEMEEAMRKLLIPEIAVQPELTRHPAVSGADLLIELHRVDCRENDDLFVKVVDASKLLFKIQRMFSSQAIQRVLNAIVSLDRVPRIAMRTVNYAIMNFHDLRRFTMEILSRLVEKPAMWNDKVLFGGIVWCLKREQLHPRVFGLFQKMTVSQVEQVFDHLEDELTRKICDHVRRCLPEGGPWAQMDDQVKKFLLKEEVKI